MGVFGVLITLLGILMGFAALLGSETANNGMPIVLGVLASGMCVCGAIFIGIGELQSLAARMFPPPVYRPTGHERPDVFVRFFNLLSGKKKVTHSPPPPQRPGYRPPDMPDGMD